MLGIWGHDGDLGTCRGSGDMLGIWGHAIWFLYSVFTCSCLIPVPGPVGLVLGVPFQVPYLVPVPH